MIKGLCKDCGEVIFLNTLSSGSQGNLIVPSISYCKCADRFRNPDKHIQGLVEYRSNPNKEKRADEEDEHLTKPRMNQETI